MKLASMPVHEFELMDARTLDRSLMPLFVHQTAFQHPVRLQHLGQPIDPNVRKLGRLDVNIFGILNVCKIRRSAALSAGLYTARNLKRSSVRAFILTCARTIVRAGA